MKRCELKEGMIIQDENNIYWRILNVSGNKRLILLDSNCYTVGDNVCTRYKEDLSSKPGYVGVKKVYSKSGDEVLWDKDSIEMTISEIESKLGLPSGSLRIKK